MKRIPAIDTLRGLSLFGILVVNVPFFMMPEGSFGSYAARFDSVWDKAATFIMHAVFEGKFILIFSFLFGWGLFTQMGRGTDFVPHYKRRLLGLLIIGLLHAVFLFVGDILVSYALLGIPLLWVREWAPRKLVRAALWCWLVSVIAHIGLGLLANLEPSLGASSYSELVVLHQTGSYEQILASRLEDLLGLYLITPFFFMPSVFGMFLLGLAAAKTFADSGLESAKPIARQVLRWFAVPAVLLNLTYAYASTFPTMSDAVSLALRAVGVVTLSLVYLSLAVLILTKPKFEKLGALAGGEGRMSLSIYILESVVMGFVAYSYGLAVYGTMGPAGQFALAVVVYAALLTFSHLWMRVFKLGPIEWVLRSFTQMRLVELR